MALIKCKECGHMISDKATKCPKCGCPIMKQEEIRTSQASQDKVQQVQPAYYEQNNSGNSKKTLYAIIGVLMALLVGLGLWMWKSESFGGNVSEKNVSEGRDSDTKKRNLDGTHLFRGEVGPYGAEMSISINGKDVVGQYHYDFQKAGVNMSLHGLLKEDGSLVMDEHTPKGTNSGRFDGIFDGKTFSGKFYNLTNGKQFSFSFSPTSTLNYLSSNDNSGLDEEVISTKHNNDTNKEENYTGGIKCILMGYISSIQNVKMVLRGNKGTLTYIMDGKQIVSDIVLDEEASNIDKDGFGHLVLKSFSPDGKLKGRFIGEMDSAECGYFYEGEFVNVNGSSTTFLLTE